MKDLFGLFIMLFEGAKSKGNKKIPMATTTRDIGVCPVIFRRYLANLSEHSLFCSKISYNCRKQTNKAFFRCMEASSQLRGKEGAIANQTVGNLDEFLYLLQGENPFYADLLEFGVMPPVYPLPESVRLYS